MKRNILIVVDMQKDFCDLDVGKLANKDTSKVVDKVLEKLKNINPNSAEFLNTVIFTRDTHSRDRYDERCPIHCIEDTKGHQLVDPIAYWKSDYSDKVDVMPDIYKDRFGYLNWDEYFRKYFNTPNYANCIDPFNDKTDFIDSIELIGVCTSICVLANALILRALYPKIHIVVDAECCADINKISHYAALICMKNQGIDVQGVDTKNYSLSIDHDIATRFSNLE